MKLHREERPSDLGKTHLMLVKYIEVAMGRAHYELLEEGEIYGEIPDLPGVYATGTSLERCRAELQEVLEGWLILSLTRHLEIPVLDGVQIHCDAAA